MLLLSAFAITCAAARAHPDDNVFITDGTETWQFIAPAGSAGAHVKNYITHTYEATRYGEAIQPAVFYNDVFKLDKASGKGKARYESAPSRNVFHDDNRVCYFDMRLEGPGKKAKVQFERTVTNPAFFSMLYLADEFPIKSKEVRIIIPPEYPGITVEELNFIPADNASISRSVDSRSDGSRIYTYRLSGLEGSMKTADESRKPHSMLFRPALLIKGWFNSVDSLCRWHADMANVCTDIPDIGSFLTEEVYGGSADKLTARMRLEKIYSWVQTNIRYVAYEEGESGHRPDRPAEVIRKRYGDCKGMALLLTTLLRHEGIEARAAVVGTTDIPFGIAENPSIAATNHSICIAVESGDTLYLDATNEHIPAHHIPGPVQGKDAIVLPVADGEYRMHNIPRLTAAATAVDSVFYNYTLTPGHDALSGTVTRTLSGDFKEMYIDVQAAGGEKYVAEKMALDLVPMRRGKIPVGELKRNYNAPDGSAVIEAPIENGEAVTDATPTLYIDLNANNGFIPAKIDNHDRRSPYLLPSRGRIVRMSQLTLPRRAKLTHLPPDYSATLPQATFSCTFSNPRPGTVCLHKTLEIDLRVIAPDDMEQWNKTLSDWENACKNQIEVTLE